MSLAPAQGRYRTVSARFFEDRRLRPVAGSWSLWGLAVGAVISGHFSGWNLGLEAGGFGGFAVAGLLILAMYAGLSFCLAEMSAVMPFAGGAYGFSRAAFGPWGGAFAGLAESFEYLLTAAVIVFFTGSYLGAIAGTPDSWQPFWWFAAYAVFLGLNLLGAELALRVALVVTLLAVAVLMVFWFSAIPDVGFFRHALDIAVDGQGQPVRLPGGNGPWFPFGWSGTLNALPYGVWLFLAIEVLPLAAEEARVPRQDIPRSFKLALASLTLSAFLTVGLSASAPPGAEALGRSNEPLLDGFRAIYGEGIGRVLALFAVLGLIASLHTLLYACGRRLFSLGRAGYLPVSLALTSRRHGVPHVALTLSALTGFIVLLAADSGGNGSATIGSLLLNMAVFSAMLSYMTQALSYLALRRRAGLHRPYRSPLGRFGAVITLVIAALTLVFQLKDPSYQKGVWLTGLLFVPGLAVVGIALRRGLVRSPEESFAEALDARD